MARIPEIVIERLKAEVTVERLVESSGIELKKSGKDWLGQPGRVGTLSVLPRNESHGG